jgi:hypothetical protein
VQQCARERERRAVFIDIRYNMWMMWNVDSWKHWKNKSKSIPSECANLLHECGMLNRDKTNGRATPT